ncbi:MAG: hypothetical protein ABUL55_02205 [Pseudomonadota bacterium]
MKQVLAAALSAIALSACATMSTEPRYGLKLGDQFAEVVKVAKIHGYEVVNSIYCMPTYPVRIRCEAGGTIVSFLRDSPGEVWADFLDVSVLDGRATDFLWRDREINTP